jgi:hypothetical protein
LSTVPCGATQQKFPYPGTAKRFDLLISHGDTTKFDVNEAEKQLLALMKLPTTIDGCNTVLKRCNKNVTFHKTHTLDFICSHKITTTTVKDSNFGPDRVG